MARPYHYVVRIYRRGYASLEGLVEDTCTGAERRFSTAEQLWSLLHRPIPRKAPSGQRRGTNDRSDARIAPAKGKDETEGE